MFFGIFKRVWFLWALSLIFNIITLLLITYQIHPQNKTLALHYNVISGVDWYGNGINLYQIPAAGFLITILNFVFYVSVKKSRTFYAPLAASTSLVVQLILLFAATALAVIN
jgi:hypothetical protein